ncbi:uncharacterized protein LOC117315521 [Pecten maximus]|uniref:uncharacterized protein LOC117315521 n=1 Tax=Pecten maximus TaxID=6579 RepID=UPI00145866BE|nr:uncharacterized protein LOC117315521 [Pecten maximus]
MACHVMAVYLLAAIAGVFVSSSTAITQPTSGLFFEKCPTGTIPASSVFNPAVGKLQLSCRAAPMPEEKCETNPTPRCSPNFSFRGLNRQGAICCKLKGIATTDCFRPKVLFSNRIGFEIPIPKGFAAVGRFSYGSCKADPTVFMLEICKLTPEMPYSNTYHWI